MRARLKVSRAGIELIKSFEGLRQTATRLPDGRWTLGYGHTFSAREGARVTQEDADALLRFDLLPIVDAVNNLVLVPLNQNQFDALVSFCFNIGVDNFAVSTVLKRLNEGKPAEAAQAMDAWRSAEFNGQTYVLAPLIRRRAAEKNLFQTPETIDPSLGMTVRPVEDVVETPAEAPLTAVRQVIDLSAPAAGDAAARQAEALAEARRAEDARLREQERLERERLEREAAARLEAERAEQQRLAAEREAALEAERREAARLEAERLERERQAEARREAERLAAERLAAERLAAERLAAEHLAREQAAREDALRQEAARREAERLEAEKAAQAAAEQSAADDAAEKARKAEAAAALMRLYSPYGGGALGRPLVAPRPVAPSQESFVQPTPIAPAATETAPIVISAQADAAPEPVVAEAEPEAAPPVESPAESPVFQSASVMPPPVITTINPYARPQTPAPQPEAPEVRAAAPAVDVTQAPFVQASPLNWREQLQRPLPQAEPDQAETPPPVTAARGASHFDEDYGDDDGWTLDGGRVAVSNETSEPEHASWWTMIVSTFWWIFISGIGLGCLGVAAGAYYKSKDLAVIRNGAFGDYMTWSIVMAAVGILCVSISVWLIMRRLGGLKD